MCVGANTPAPLDTRFYLRCDFRILNIYGLTYLSPSLFWPSVDALPPLAAPAVLRSFEAPSEAPCRRVGGVGLGAPTFPTGDARARKRTPSILYNRPMRRLRRGLRKDHGARR